MIDDNAISHVPDIRRLFSMGNETRQYTGVKRQQVRWDERLQRGDHVRNRGSDKLRPGRQTRRNVHYVGGVHNILQHGHPVPGIRTEGTT